jgi:hypothetical protein
VTLTLLGFAAPSLEKGLERRDSYI